MIKSKFCFKIYRFLFQQFLIWSYLVVAQINENNKKQTLYVKCKQMDRITSKLVLTGNKYRFHCQLQAWLHSSHILTSALHFNMDIKNQCTIMHKQLCLSKTETHMDTAHTTTYPTSYIPSYICSVLVLGFSNASQLSLDLLLNLYS